MVQNLHGKDILMISDWTREELDQVLNLAFKFKQMGVVSRSLNILKGKTLLLLFFRPSTRTRLSFTAAMQQLGGFVQIPEISDLRFSLEDQPGGGESIKDTARVVQRYVDAIGIRHLVPINDGFGVPRPGGGDAIMRKFAEYASIPIINLASCLEHPTQALADVMVMKEKMGDLKGKKITITWAYSSLLRSWCSTIADATISALYGMNVTLAYPEGYDLDEKKISAIYQGCEETGAKFEISHDFKKALEGADIVTPRNWWSPRYYMNTKEEEQRLAAQYREWKLTESMLKLTNNARFMHVMPFDRGNEVDDSVADGPNSIVYDQAENLLHVRKAFLASILSEQGVVEKK